MSMVKETRIIFDPSDIRRMRVVCKCGADITYPHSKKHFSNPLTRCPSCGDEWWDPNFPNDRPRVRYMLELLRVLHSLAGTEGNDEPNFKVSFEIEDA